MNRLKKYETLKMIVEYLIAGVLIAMCLAVSFYAKWGYYQIDEAKFEAYKVVMLIGTPVVLMAGALYWHKNTKKDISVTDICVLGYLMFSMLSVVSGGFYKDVMWGSQGWHMGFLTQLSFVLIYLMVSRFGGRYREVLAVFCGASLIVLLIGVLHRLMIDPVGFYKGLLGSQMAQFLSTIGQASWYGGYLAVALPIGISIFLFAKKSSQLILGGIYTAIGFASLVTQNSDSAYFALFGFMLIFFCVCIERRETLNRFVEVCTLFFLMSKIMHFLLKIRSNPALEYDFITSLVLDSAVTWVLLAGCLFLCIILHMRKDKPYPVAGAKVIRKAVLLIVAVVFAVVIVLIVLQSKGVLPDSPLGAIAYFNFNDTWGNSRGRIWSFAVRVFRQESICHKFFGIGSDCLSSYVREYHNAERQLLWGDLILTNAHNEWLTMLINVGIFGAIAYIGIFATLVKRCLKSWRTNPLLVGIAASAVSYMAYNFFCYQTICCTPFIFMLLGIGEYVLRSNKES